MQTYYFTFILADDPRDLETWSNAFYEAGGDDSTVGVDRDGLSAAFHREASSLDDALRTAAEVVRRAGMKIQRCVMDADDLDELFKSE